LDPEGQDALPDPSTPMSEVVKYALTNSDQSDKSNIVQSKILDEKLNTSPSSDVKISSTSSSPFDALYPNSLIYPYINSPLEDYANLHK
jgi:hypothetical protein